MSLDRSPTVAVPSPLITRSPERLSGAAVFAHTRVPVQALIDYLEGGDTLDAFLADFPAVTREHAVAVLELARQALDAHATVAAQRPGDGVRLVLDHCVPWGLARLLAAGGRAVEAVAALGLADADDGPVLDRIAGRCDAFVT